MKCSECKDGSPEYTLDEVAEHRFTDSIWIVYVDKVYDITPFVHEHPGGLEILLEHAGEDATTAFKETGHSKEAREILSQYFIGNLIKDERIYKNKAQKGKACRRCSRSESRHEEKRTITDSVDKLI